MSAATAILERTDAENSNVFDRAVCLAVTFRRLGVRRRLSLSDLKPGVEASPDLVSASKKLFNAPELDAIAQHDGATRRYLESKVSGPALFKNGVYMLSYQILPEVDDELQTRLKEREDVLVPRLLAKWDSIQEEAKRALGPLYRAEQYPTRDEVARAFSVSTRYFTLGAPTQLESIRADIFEREGDKARAMWASVLDESRAVLRAEMGELVSHMVDRLTPDASGKGKRFSASTVENLDAFLSDFAKRDIANDRELQAVVEEARAALQGMSPKRLRESEVSREAVAAKFGEIKTRLDRLVVVGGRCYDLDGE